MSAPEIRPRSRWSALRIVSWLFVVCILLIAGLIGAILLPSVQQRILERQLIRFGAREVHLAGVHVTPFSFTAEQVAFVQGGLRVDARGLNLKVEPRRLFSHQIHVEEFLGQSLDVALELPPTRQPGLRSAAGPGPAAKPAALANPFPLRLPWTVVIGKFDVGGKFSVRSESAELGAGDWHLSGGDLAPGGTGTMRYELRPNAPGAAKASGGKIFGALEVAESSTGTIAPAKLELSIDSVPLAWANQLPGGKGIVGLGGSLSGSVLATTALSGTTVRYELRPDAPAGVKVGGGKISGSLEIPQSSNGAITSAKLDLTAASIPLIWANQAASAHGIEVLDGALSGHVLAATDSSGTTLLPGTGLQLANLKARKAQPALAINRPQGVTLSIELLKPYLADPAHPLAPLEAAGDADWAHVAVGNVPLEIAAPWLPGRQIAGTWTQGDATVRYLKGQGWRLTATAPWKFTDVSYAEGGEQMFHGSVALKPILLDSKDTQWVRFTELTVSDTRGYNVVAHGGIVLKGKEDQVAGGITLQATLPFFPGMPEKKGPYGVALSATAHLLSDGKKTLSKLTATVTGKQGEMLATVAAEQPITIEQTPDTEWLVSSPKPLVIKTAQVPLAGIESFFNAHGLEAEGILPATEFALWFTPRHFRLEPKTPLAVQRFHLERDHQVLVDRALLRCTPAFELAFEHHLLPTVRWTASTSTSIKAGLIKVDGNRVALFDLKVDLDGTEKSFATKDLQGGLWVDLGAMGQTGLFSHARLPGKGEFRVEFGKSSTDPRYLEFQGGLARVTGRDGKIAPTVEFFGRAQGDVGQKSGGFGVRTTIIPVPTAAAAKPRPTEFHFGFKADFQHLALFDISSRLESDYVNLDDVTALAAAFSPAVVAPPPARPPGALGATHAATAAAPAPVTEAAPWGMVRGHFTLGIKELVMAPYSIKNLGGKLELTDTQIALTGLSGEILGGKWSADFSAGLQPGNQENPVGLKAHFAMNQIDAAQAVHLRYPDPPAGIDGKLNLDVTVTGEAKTWEGLPAASTGQFVMTATGGRMRLVLPKKDMISTALIIGGMFTFSSEMRALGRFVQTLEDLPINQIRATGTLARDGKLKIQTVSLDSPQLKLNADGEVANAKTRDLMGEPLLVNASLSATGDMAVILSGMNLLEKGTGNGFRKMKEPFLINGQLGQPNLQPLYDMLAKAVDGSSGSWGILMRKVAAMVPKAAAKPSS